MEQDTVELPAWIKEPVLLALGDLQEPGANELALKWHPEGDNAGILAAGEPVNASQRFDEDELVPATLVVRVADWLQNQLFPDSTVSPTDARPVCPGHDHPLQARVLYDVAWWFCRTSNSPIRLIGES